MLEIDNSRNPVILYDTNFLLLPEQFKVDVFEKPKELLGTINPFLCIFDKTINELEKISNDRSKHSLAAKIGLQLVKKLKKENKLSIIDTNNETTYVDKLILSYTKFINPKILSNFYVATQDKVLKLELKEKKVKIIVLAQKSILKVF